MVGNKSKTCCQGGLQGYHEIGRAVATVMSDEVFHDVAYKAQKRDHLLAGLDEFLDAVTVLPPGEWDPTIRIEPPSVVRQEELIWSGTWGVNCVKTGGGRTFWTLHRAEGLYSQLLYRCYMRDSRL